jgi:hypothetical protein
MRLFHQTWPPAAISESLIRKSTSDVLPGNSEAVVRTFEFDVLADYFSSPGLTISVSCGAPDLPRRGRSMKPKRFAVDGACGNWTDR